MRSHAKASLVGSTLSQAGFLGPFLRGAFPTRGASPDNNGSSAPARQGTAADRSIFALVCLFVLSFTALLAAFSATASAAVVTDRPLLFAFDGSDTTAGRFPVDQFSEGGPRKIAIDNSTGAVYVSYNGERAPLSRFVSKFNPDGSAADFAATGTSSLFAAGGSEFADPSVAVDNSGGPNQGRLHINDRAARRLHAFDLEGNQLWTLVPSVQAADVAVGPSGHPWLLPSGSPNDGVQRFDNTGFPPSLLCSFPFPGGEAIDVDAAGNLYIQRSGEVKKYTGGCAGTLDSTLDVSAFDVYADQSSPAGHLFTVHTGDFQEFDSTGALLGTHGTDYVRSIVSRNGIAYSPSLDRVYVALKASFSDPTPVVAVFGPAASGTVPDVTEIAEPSSVGISSAHFEGTVNPQNVASKAHFEWKRFSQSWAAADLLQSSAPQALTANETPQAVEFDTNRLRGNRTYEVRLITVNDGDKLRAFSAAKTFTTLQASAAPEVTIDPVTATATTTATVEGTVNPKGDTADWRVQLQNNCSGGFSNQPLRALAEGSEAPVAVEDDLEGLLPSERYCARISATNSFGTATSTVEEFETDPVVPSEVETAFAAPRTDTTARLNARVNPEGEALTFRFQYSKDGGTTWIALPDREDTSEARTKFILAEELTGLSPDTPYSYRVVAENDAGSVQSEAKAFSTRPTPVEPVCPNAEIRAQQHSAYMPDCRAFELVNNPDKGNQDVSGPGNLQTPVMAPNGEAALWQVIGGAPGANLPASNAFVATRTANGWRSSAIAPPADRQVGELYVFETATPALSHFVMSAVFTDGLTSLVRLDRNQNQDLLKDLPAWIPATHRPTDDGARVFSYEPETEQIEKLGAGESAEVVSIQPDGEPSECGANMSLADGIFHNSATRAYEWIDTIGGSRAYFRSQPNGSCSAPLGLFVRNLDTQQTTMIDPGNAVRDVELIRATPDGRSAYFSTASQLDPADQNTGGDVYRWDEAMEVSTCLTCAAHPDVRLAIRNGVFTPVMVSDDLSHIYFESTAQLTPEATPGHSGIYTVSAGTIRFVADTNFAELDVLGVGDADLSADGNVLVFAAESNPGLTADVVEPAGAKEVYRYDDRDGSLECISCRHGGVTSHVGSLQGKSLGSVMSSDGAVIAFSTAEALVPLDVNQGPDIYRWRDGSPDLITDGVSDFTRPPEVWSVDADGSDILFSVVAPGLTGFEQDGLTNLYDARVGGGFDPPTVPAHCAEDSCQGPLLATPALAQAASSTFGGRGNLAAVKRCRAGAVRRGKRCVSKRSLANRACRKKSGKAKRRCVSKRLRRINRKARAHRDTRRTK